MMRSKSVLLAAIVAVLVAAVTAGCGGGSKTQNVNTPWRGSIAGVDTLPPDNDIDVAVDTWVKVYWPDSNYEPPQSFTFRLYRWTSNGWATVQTVYKSADSRPDYGEWWFAPENLLAYYTDYKIVVTDNYGDSHTHYFTTIYDPTRARVEQKAEPKHYWPEGGGTPGGQAADEHVIITRP